VRRETVNVRTHIEAGSGRARAILADGSGQPSGAQHTPTSGPDRPGASPCPAPVTAYRQGDTMTTATPDEIRTAVKDRYAAAARAAADGGTAGSADYTATLYPREQRDELPATAALASLGCGNPTLLAELQPGQTVLDLGSGGGLDVLLSARRVAPGGTAYGLDMTEDMLDLARRNQREAGITNAEFLHGTIEHIPLPDASVDVIISNCVINLAADKDPVFREAVRVLRPGGRLAVSDIVLIRPLPAPAQHIMALWTGCVAGALTADDYAAKLRAAGFIDVDLTVTQVYDRSDITAAARANPQLAAVLPADADPDALLDALAGAVTSTFVRARKPSES
jgi:arsenite methyltransferase